MDGDYKLAFKSFGDAEPLEEVGKQERLEYTIVYYEVLQRLKLDLKEYCLLDFLKRHSKGLEYSKTKSFASERLGIERSTLSKRLKILEKRNFIELYGRKIRLNLDLDEKFRPQKCSRFNPDNDVLRYIKIYFKDCKDKGYSYSRYAVLYMMFSLARKRDPWVRINPDFFEKRINIKLDQLNKDKSALRQDGFITKKAKGIYYLTSFTLNHFNELEIGEKQQNRMK